ncbi:MAG: hypothetical protein IKN50_04925, partial [Clostridia bacterium]|nr:hypothetical protein [Clostridia bacterium]
MTVILCVDSGRGMTFFGRRQSTDSAVTERIVRFADGARLLIGVDSAPLFKGRKVNAVVSDDLLSEAMPGDVCFLERDDPKPFAA